MSEQHDREALARILTVWLQAHDEDPRIDGGDLADTVIANGFRCPRVVETVEELEAMPDGSVVRDNEDVCEKHTFGTWFRVGDEMIFPASLIQLPAAVLFEPGEAE